MTKLGIKSTNIYYIKTVEYRSHLHAPLLKRIEESPFDPLGVLGLWAAGNLLLKHLYHSRHQALNCIEIVGTLQEKWGLFTLFTLIKT